MGTLGESSPPFADESSGGEDIGLAVSSEGATVKTAKQWEVRLVRARAGAWIEARPLETAEVGACPNRRSEPILGGRGTSCFSPSLGPYLG